MSEEVSMELYNEHGFLLTVTFHVNPGKLQKIKKYIVWKLKIILSSEIVDIQCCTCTVKILNYFSSSDSEKDLFKKKFQWTDFRNLLISFIL